MKSIVNKLPVSIRSLICSMIVIANSFASDLQVFEIGKLEINRQIYTIEIARTFKQRQQGLMFRQQLAHNSGMLFVYPDAGYHRIWMKNTLIPLTVIWLDNTATILAVKQLVPCHADPCQSYGVDSPSNFVLELPAGFSGLKSGDKIPDIVGLE